MFYGAHYGSVKIGHTQMDYIAFGRGERALVMIPGLGDALRTLKHMSIPFAAMYRQYAKRFQVYVFSRKSRLEDGYSTRDMADDLAEAMQKLGLSKASVMGFSQGGMIAQHMAIRHPQRVEKLVLAVTVCRPNDTLLHTVGDWVAMAEAGDYKGIVVDTAERSYSEKALQKYRPFYPILSRLGKPKDFGRFIIQAHACMQHDAYLELPRIQCPTLAIGGGSDKVVGGNATNEIAASIPHCKCIVYEGLGHMAYEEADDFDAQVLRFLTASD